MAPTDDFVFGHIDGVPAGQQFDSFDAMVEAGVHGVHSDEIWSRAGVGVSSVVLNGGHPDDLDRGHIVFYTGSGGQDTTGEQVADQTLATGHNAELEQNRLTGNPIRVLRGSNGDPSFSPESGFRYDGLYKVTESWRGPSSTDATKAFQMVTFLLEQLDDDWAIEDLEPVTASHRRKHDDRSNRRSLDAAVRNAIERRAIDVVLDYFEDDLGFEVRDVGVLGSPYEVVALGNGAQLRIKVKGGVGQPQYLSLTSQEIGAAAGYPDSALAFVDRISLDSDSDPMIATGGRLRVWLNWAPTEEQMSPVEIKFPVPFQPDLQK